MRVCSLVFAIGCMSLSLLACDDSSNGLGDEPGVVVVTDDAKADTAGAKPPQGNVYYSVTRDTRRCAWPLCGGYYVANLNYSKTLCNDGIVREECYVVDFDVESGLLLDANEAALFRTRLGEGTAVVRGSIKTATYGKNRLGYFIPTEGWVAASIQAPKGTFYQVAYRPVACFVAPCPSYQETFINGNASTKPIHAVELAGAGAEELATESAIELLHAEPLLVVGSNSNYAVSGRPGIQLNATQFYTRVRHDALVAHTPTMTELGGKAFVDLAAVKPAYPRTYRFDASSGSVSIEDAVAPCPPGAVCIWSGIITRAATWSLAGDRIRLSYTGTQTPRLDGSIAYYNELAVAKDANGKLVIVEISDDGSSGRRFRE